MFGPAVAGLGFGKNGKLKSLLADAFLDIAARKDVVMTKNIYYANRLN